MLLLFCYSSKLLENIPEDIQSESENDTDDVHDDDDVHGDVTNREVVDMDVSHIVQNFIETNIPASDLLIERHNPKCLLLPPGYETEIFNDIDLEVQLENVKEQRVIVDLKNLCSLFKTCLHPSCNDFIRKVTPKFIGCSTNIHWECIKNHKGVWSSSGTTRGMYTNNLMMAMSVLYSGNNIKKINDFCHTFNLNGISDRTFEFIQRKYLFPAIDDYFQRTQDIMFRYSI